MFLKTVLIAVSLIAVSHTFKLQPRIFRGSNSSRGQFPYFVLLEIISTNDSVLMCGGSLIDKEWVLTAGHCIENETVIDLHFGSFSVEDTSEAGRVVMTVKKENLILHPDYLDEGTHYDIGLIKLPKPIELSRYIQPIELDMKCDLNEIFNVTVVGNGGTSTYGDVASTLQYAYLETTRMDICEALFPFIENRISVRCVRGKNLESLCPGDSGGNKLVVVKYSLMFLYFLIYFFRT